MKSSKAEILTINGGSSSIKFAFYQGSPPLERGLYGEVERIGQSGTKLRFHDPATGQEDYLSLDESSYHAATDDLLDWLTGQDGFAMVKAVGHRVVHGMQHTMPALVTEELLDELHHTCPYDPEHLPNEIELIETFRRRHPKLPQVACFDTTFHHAMPRVAKLLPLPRRYEAQGLRRYGFHGLSYSYLLEELARIDAPTATRGRVILVHLGNGASLAAVLDGNSIDTSMGFTPNAGMMMSTRSGDLDPGVYSFLRGTESMSPRQFDQMVNHESGLLGISETSSDMRDLLANESTDERAAEAIELFCYQVKKWIGAYAAVLGGLDTLVFSGGIGENAPQIRERICANLDFLGFKLHNGRNSENAQIISTDASHTKVRVIRTNEQQMIAAAVFSELPNLS